MTHSVSAGKDNLTVAGVVFSHWFDPVSAPDCPNPKEWYEHIDTAAGWVWLLFRHLIGPYTGNWYAMVVDQHHDRASMLNTVEQKPDGSLEKDPLYDLCPAEPRVLLPALVQLMAARTWAEIQRFQVSIGPSVTENTPSYPAVDARGQMLLPLGG